MDDRQFPPAIVPRLRDRFGRSCIDGVADRVLDDLVTVVFFAGLETHEGERNPIRVLFTGTYVDTLVATAGGEPVYRWRPMTFNTPRLCSVEELVKLAVATRDERAFVHVYVDDDDLVIAGLAREGASAELDPFVKVLSPRPGALSIRGSRDVIVDYEHGWIRASGNSAVFDVGPVRRALEATARVAGLEEALVPSYLASVRALVTEMAAHGRGGVLVVSRAERPDVPSATPYRVKSRVSLGTLLRIAAKLDKRAPERTFGRLLQSAYAVEIERTIADIGALTAIDGATILSAELGLASFGSVLSVTGDHAVGEARDLEATHRVGYDLGKHGTRHRAAAAYAAEHAGSLVFLASADGPVKCFLREPPDAAVTMWRVESIDAPPSSR